MEDHKVDLRADKQSWLAMVEGLLNAPGWATDDPPIEMIQTHISVVLLGRRHVLKLKKPVDFGFLDYTTLEKCRRACETEIKLNRRLCPDIYLRVQPIVETKSGFQLSDLGRIVDYGVLMKRLPNDLMVDRMVARNVITESIIDRIADRLSHFHQEAMRGPEIDSYGSPELIRRNWEENFAQTAHYISRTITAPEYGFVRTQTMRWLDNLDDLLKARVRDGRICDGHGDVRCESICVTNGICIFDCIEFNERFRCGDVASEVAFLSMDLHARGRPDLGYYFSERYHGHTADPQIFILLPFYKCYRAYVRGKVLSFRLDEPEFSEDEREVAASRARNYFDLARRYAAPLAKPTIIAVAGLSGTGKTSVARAIAEELGLRVISSDAVRKSLFQSGKQSSRYGEGIYNAEASRLTYQKLMEEGRTFFNKDKGVILDATFQRAQDRSLVREMAAANGAKWRLIECQSPPDLIHERLDRRDTLKDGLSDATWETYLHQRNQFEPVSSSSKTTHLVLDTRGSQCENSHAATDWLRANDHN
jgi:aminoglycoside phosphotransferase family enzyme/predicted kinase